MKNILKGMLFSLALAVMYISILFPFIMALKTNNVNYLWLYSPLILICFYKMGEDL